MKMNRKKILGAEIRRARIACGLTQREFAESESIAVQTISSYETGAREPSALVLLHFARRLKLNLNLLARIVAKTNGVRT